MEEPVFSSPEFAGMRGAYAAMFTPLAPDGSVNEAMIERLVEHGLSNGLPFMIYSIRAAVIPDKDVKFFDLPNVKDEQLVCALAYRNVFSCGIGTTYNIIPRHFAEICRLSFAGDAAGAAKMQDEANRVVELMIENENWSYRKAMMKYIGLDCGPYRHPYAPLTEEEYTAFARRIDALGILPKCGGQ